jgi:hypothetical protein
MPDSSETYAKQIENALKLRATEEELFRSGVDFFNLQEKINVQLEKEGDSIQRLIGGYKSIQMNMITRFKREYQLKKDIRNLDEEMGDVVKKIATMKEGALKDEMKLSFQGMVQRQIMYKKEAELLGKINKSGLGVLLYLLSNTINLFKVLDAAASEFRHEVGLTRDNSLELKQTIQDVTISYMGMGVTAQIVNKSLIAAGAIMGGMKNVTKDIVENISLLNAQLGTSTNATAKMLRDFAVLSNSTMSAQINMVYFTQALSAAAGINFNQVAGDFERMSNAALVMVSRVPLIMAKTAVDLRRMGTDINTAASASEHLLDFTQNIQEEMEASVLLGHSINLQKARLLAYNRNIEGSTREILRLAVKNNFAHGMDRFQMEAFARATGRSVEDLLSMVQASEEINKALSSTDPKIRAAAKEYERIKNSNSASAEALAKSVQYQLMTKSNQERIVAISQKWHQIMAQLGAVFLPRIDNILQVVAEGLGDIAKLTIPIIFGMRSIFNAIKLSSLYRGVELMIKMGKPMSSIVGFAGKFMFTFQKIGGIFSMLSKFSGILDFTKAIPGLGEIIMVIQGIYYGIKSVWEIFTDFKKELADKGIFYAIFSGLIKLSAIGPKIIWEALIKPILHLGGVIIGLFSKDLGDSIKKGIDSVDIFGIFTYPFRKVWSWFTGSPLAGQSPSQLGLSIVKGIVSVGSMIFDAITSPFRMAFSWILKHIPGMSNIANRIQGGLTGLNKPIEAKAAPGITTPIQAIPNETPIYTPTGTDEKTAKTVGEGIAKSIDLMTEATGKAIVSKLDEFLMALKNGGISVNMDGSLVSTMLARNLEFRGNFGVNR